jgi:hypothetical protein
MRKIFYFRAKKESLKVAWINAIAERDGVKLDVTG